MQTTSALRLSVYPLMWVFALSGTSSAWALDPDIQINNQARLESVTPVCRMLVVQSAEGTPEHTYQKGLCLLYGLQTPKQLPLALALLRQAAGSGWVEAQLAVADTLQQSNDADQREAMRWYASAATAGDVRASGRLARLTQRRAAQEAAKTDSKVDPAAPSGASPLPSEDTENLPFKPQGYHCHVSGLGKKFCHSALD